MSAFYRGIPSIIFYSVEIYSFSKSCWDLIIFVYIHTFKYIPGLFKRSCWFNCLSFSLDLAFLNSILWVSLLLNLSSILLKSLSFILPDETFACCNSYISNSFWRLFIYEFNNWKILNILSSLFFFATLSLSFILFKLSSILKMISWSRLRYLFLICGWQLKTFFDLGRDLLQLCWVLAASFNLLSPKSLSILAIKDFLSIEILERVELCFDLTPLWFWAVW